MPLIRSVLHSGTAPDLVQRLFAPLLRAIPDARFHTRADHRRRSLSAAAIVVVLVFQQMRRLESLRALVDALDLSSRVRSVLGLPAVKRSTLSDALSGRLRKKNPDTRLLDFTHLLFQTVARQAALALGTAKNTASAFLAVDGTVFTATAKMIFARFDQNRNALKAHVGYAVDGYVPTFITLTKATACEKKQLRQQIHRGHTYILDRGYVGFDLFHAIKKRRAWFVTRMKKGIAAVVAKSLDITPAERQQGVRRDEIVHLEGGKLRLRRVVYRAQDGRVFEYLTNQFTLSSLEIADLYKSRWAVETFFKFLKHCLVTRHLISRTLVGFHIQLFAAAIAYLLFAIHFGPNRHGRPPVSLSQMRRLADRVYEEIILASAAANPGHGRQQAPPGDSALNRGLRDAS
jgi:hypothetical protein